MADLLVLTNNPNSASFLYRMEPYLPILEANGIHCNVDVFPAKPSARRRLFRYASSFDGVFLHRKTLSWHDARLLRRHAKTILYDFDDAIMVKGGWSLGLGLKRSLRFRRTVKAADLVIAGNGYLAGRAKPLNPRTVVLPTGVDIRMYQGPPLARTDGLIRLVWIGSKSTLPYLEEIRPALEQIGRRFPKVHLRIICDRFFHLEHMLVETCLWSKVGHVGDLLGSDIGLAPLPDNAFTRGKCGFKILQYSACGLPVVASPVGVNADYVKMDVTGLHAAGITEWVHQIGVLIENRSLREQMGQAARNFVQRFDKEAIGRQLIDLIKTALQEGRGSDEITR